MRLGMTMMMGAALAGWTGAAAARTTEVVVRANRFAAYSGDAAFSTVDAGADDLRGAPDLDTALKRAAQAGLFRRSSSNTANPSVQGVGLRALAPSGAGRALVTLDGVPQNDPFGNWVIWTAMPQMALSHARDVYTRRNEGVSIWVVRSDVIAASSPDEKDPLFAPSNDKVYRHPTFYEIPDNVPHM